MIAKYRQQGVEGWILTDFTMEQIENELANLGELKQCEKAHTYNVKYHVLCPICTEHKLRRELEQVKRERDEQKLFRDTFLRSSVHLASDLIELKEQLVIERKRADDNEKALELACKYIPATGFSIPELIEFKYSFKHSKLSMPDYFRNYVRKAQEGK